MTADTGANEASRGADETIVNVNGEKSEEKEEVRETEAANKEEIESIKAAQAKRSADKEAARLARKKRELQEIETILAKKEGTKTAPEEKAEIKTTEKENEVVKPSSQGSAVGSFIDTFVVFFKKIVSLFMFWRK